MSHLNFVTTMTTTVQTSTSFLLANKERTGRRSPNYNHRTREHEFMATVMDFDGDEQEFYVGATSISEATALVELKALERGIQVYHINIYQMD